MTTIMWEGDVKLLGIIGVTALLTGLVVSGATLAQEVERPSNYGEKPIAPARVTGDYTADYQVLQPLSDKPGKRNFGEYGEVYYVPSTPETILWGYLPNRNSKPVLTVPSGSTIVFDTVSHEGIQEDQGRNPVNFFGQYGIPEQYVLQDAKAIAASSLEHDFVKAGPHVVTGPLEIEGAQPGDVLMVETLDLKPRVPYGVVSNLLTPLIQQETVALPPALTIASLVLFGALFGPLGLMLGTPLAAVGLVLVRMAYVEDVLEQGDVLGQ
jgi:hypothetical protein